MDERVEEHIVYPEVTWSPYSMYYGDKLRNMTDFFGVFPFYAEPDEIDDCHFEVVCPDCQCDLLEYDDNTYIRDAHDYVEVDVPDECWSCGAKLFLPREDDVRGGDYENVTVAKAIDFIATISDWSLFIEPKGRRFPPKYHLVHNEHCAEAIANGWELVTDDNVENYNFDHKCFHYGRNR